jgi:AraC-like DNA-binding protein
MIYREIAPHPKLRRYIKCFWMLDHDYRNSFHDHERLWADVHTELIFTSGQRYFTKTGKRKMLPASFVIGPYQKELELFSSGRTALVAARFWPWGFHAVSRIAMSRLKNTVQNMATVFACNNALPGELARIANPHMKIAALEQSLLNIFDRNQSKLLSRDVASAILDAEGIVRVSDLSREHGLHGRRLQRVFLDEIGMPAKMFSRIVRFNHAMKTIQSDPDVELLSLTYACGYSDQAHFTRNFREMFGITPADFKARMQEARKRFREKRPDVVFLQDQPQ